jgi:MFS family permease
MKGAIPFLKLPSTRPAPRIASIRSPRFVPSSGWTRASSSYPSSLLLHHDRGESIAAVAVLPPLRPPLLGARDGLDHGPRHEGGTRYFSSCDLAPPAAGRRPSHVDAAATWTRRRRSTTTKMMTMMMMMTATTTTRGSSPFAASQRASVSTASRQTRRHISYNATDWMLRRRRRRRPNKEERSQGGRHWAAASQRRSLSTQPPPAATPAAPQEEQRELSSSSSSSSFIERHFSKEAATYPRHYRGGSAALDSNDNKQQPNSDLASRRWLQAMVPACIVHFSIGSVYAYSMWTPGMATALGVVANSVNDWTQSQVLPVFSCSALVLGVTTSQFGSWIEQVGPRKAAALGTVLWTSALATTAVGVHFHSLPLVYGGWGILGGVGWGFMYLSPLSSVLPWFPDKRGLASGITLTSFGCGAALAPIAIHSLVTHFAIPPDYIGPLWTETTNPSLSVLLDTLSDGSQVVAANSPAGVPGTPVVVATHADLLRFASSSGPSLQPGAYELSTGDSGVPQAMATLAALSGILGLAGSRFLTVPNPQCVPELAALSAAAPAASAAAPSNSAPGAPKQEPPELSLDHITWRTSQFPLLWLCVFGNATGGLALLTSSKLMFADIWTGVAPNLVTPAFATAYVTALGAGMALGRLGWSAASDKLGRQTTYAIFGLGIPIVALSPALTRAAVDASHAAAASMSVDAAAAATTSLVVAPMVAAFCGGSVLAVTFYGGVFSVLPGYVADLFGTKHASALVGKLLTAFAASAVVGPMGLAYLRSHATHESIQQLLLEVHDRDAFAGSFGCSVDDLDSIQKLIDAKTITIARLMELVPPHTVDPTPFLYDTTCYGAAALMGVSFAANYFIRPPIADGAGGGGAAAAGGGGAVGRR